MRNSPKSGGRCTTTCERRRTEVLLPRDNRVSILSMTQDISTLCADSILTQAVPTAHPHAAKARICTTAPATGKTMMVTCAVAGPCTVDMLNEVRSKPQWERRRDCAQSALIGRLRTAQRLLRRGPRSLEQRRSEGDTWPDLVHSAALLRHHGMVIARRPSLLVASFRDLMLLRAKCSITDLARFALLNLVAIGLTAAWLTTIRVRIGDGPDASNPVAIGTLTILVGAALTGSVLIALAHRAWLAAILSLATGWVLIAGASTLFTLLVPKAYEAIGPGAMALLWVVVASIGATIVGIVLRV